ncbi:hypothetical protein [Bradyrhizobium sp. STM 3557]|uniref:hypothetical protein n=1 Tax=Bradyrhizobium sp. STM 3557 TaxID=578920 RepID=UPI00388F7FCC
MSGKSICLILREWREKRRRQRAAKPPIRLQLRTNFFKPINALIAVKPPAQKYSCFYFSEFMVYFAIPCLLRGVSRPFTSVEHGMRWAYRIAA